MKRYRAALFLQAAFGRPGWVKSPHSGRTSSVNGELARELRFFQRPRTAAELAADRRMPLARARVRVGALVRRGLLFDAEVAQDRLFRLEGVQIDPNGDCNHRCVYCPVSERPKPRQVMPMPLFRRILDQLAPYRRTLKFVALSAYNEPTLDPEFLARYRELRARDLRLLLLTNASGLRPRVVDELAAGGGCRVEVNLPTLDERQYRALHGAADLAAVLGNVRRALAKGMPMTIQVQGLGDKRHRANFAAIRRFVRGTAARAVLVVSADRAGLVRAPWALGIRRERLAGCDCSGSRPINWLHVNPRGQCFLCCQDFDEKYLIGDARRQPLTRILGGARAARLRRWVYGLEAAPDDFICRRCLCAVAAPALGG